MPNDLILKRPQLTAGARMTQVPSLWQRLSQASRYVVSSVTPNSWFGPDQPIAPFAPPEAKGRWQDYQIGYNLGITPRAEETVSFQMMRSLADGYDVLRLLLETRKDQIAKMPWQIAYAGDSPKLGAEVDDDPRVKLLKNAFIYPNREDSWDTWLRMLVEDVLVIDAPSIYPRMTKGGGVYSLDLIDGSMFKRIIDPWGRTPVPPDPAYQQSAHGVPMADYTRDELIYYPRNKRTNKLYGYSPVEQMIVTINIGLRRELSQLYYFTEGTIPDALVQLPDDWSPEQIMGYQAWFDNVSGLDDRRKMRFIPGTKGSGGVTLTKEPSLKTDFDEWAVRIMCFALSISPQPFIKMMNRSTSQNAQEQAIEEGLIPFLRFLEDLFNLIIVKYFGFADLRFKFDLQRDVDPAVQAKIDDINLRNGSSTLDEVRSNRGDDEIGKYGSRHLVYTANGVMPIDTAIENADNPPEPPPAAPLLGGPQGRQAANGKPPPGKPQAPAGQARPAAPARQSAKPIGKPTQKRMRTIRRYATEPRRSQVYGHDSWSTKADE